MVYECNYLNKIPTHSLNHLSSFQCRKSLLALASLGWNEMHRRWRGEWNSIYVKLFFAKFNAPKMVGCLLAKCWRLGGQLIRIQFHKYISPHYILLNPMLFYTNYLWVSPFYFACHLSFLSLFQTTILKIASVWVWMCVCVYLPLIFTSCYAALLAHDRFPTWLPIFFPNHSPFSKRKQSPSS